MRDGTRSKSGKTSEFKAAFGRLFFEAAAQTQDAYRCGRGCRYYVTRAVAPPITPGFQIMRAANRILFLCTGDYYPAQLVIALKEAEHRPMIERRFPVIAERVIYWHVDDIEFAHPSIALAMIDDHVAELISKLRAPALR